MDDGQKGGWNDSQLIKDSKHCIFRDSCISLLMRARVYFFFFDDFFFLAAIRIFSIAVSDICIVINAVF
jgi:hypothetical protein